MAQSIERLTVATVNTQLGRAIREPHGLKPLDGVDILLMQEVMMDGSELVERVHEQIGLRIGHFDDELGLAIALLPGQFITKHHRVVFQERGMVGNSIDSTKEDMQKSRFRFRGRGLIGISLVTAENNPLAVATMHPTIPLKPLARSRQVKAMVGAVAKIREPLILAGDMNHWPGPRGVDNRMREKAKFTPVEIPEGQSTFEVEKTSYKWLGDLAARFGLNINGQLDAMLYRGEGLSHEKIELVDVASDHKALLGSFSLTHY